MPRCISSVSPEDSTASRYLARRSTRTTVWPFSRAAKRCGNGPRRSGRRTSTRTKRAPFIAGSIARRVDSTSGSSGTPYSDRSACITSTRDARAAGISDASTAARDQQRRRAGERQDPGHVHVGQVARDQPRQHDAADRAGERRRRRPSPRLRRGCRSAAARGCRPIARRTPNSRVRALTENASTPATPTTAMVSATAAKIAEHQRVEPIRRQHLGADVVERRRLFDRLLRRQIADDPRDRRHQRVGIASASGRRAGRRRTPARAGGRPPSPVPGSRSRRRCRRRRRRCAAARC